ncbi:unnamed protein product [Urochloa humidicola]
MTSPSSSTSSDSLGDVVIPAASASVMQQVNIRSHVPIILDLKEPNYSQCSSANNSSGSDGSGSGGSRNKPRQKKRGRGSGPTNSNPGSGGGNSGNGGNGSGNGGGRSTNSGNGDGSGAPNQPQGLLWAAGYNPWTGFVQACPMTFRAPGAGVLAHVHRFSPRTL